MKILAAADLHLTSACPVNRIDNYEETALRKFDQILSIARQHDAVLTVSGDFWDTTKMSKIPYELTNKVIQMLRMTKVRMLACHGQHDMAYHNPNLQSSPYYTLLVAGAMEIPGPMGISIGNVRFFGSGWGQDIPMPEEKNPDLVEVLLLHRTITEYEPPFFLKDGTSAAKAMEVLRNFDFILSGDYHEAFIRQEADRFLVNCGPMLRQKITERTLKPVAHLIDTDERTVTSIPLDVRDDVWNDERIEKQKQHEVSVSTTDLLKAMNEQSDRPDFIEILDTVLQDVGEEGLVNLVREVVAMARKKKEGV